MQLEQAIIEAQEQHRRLKDQAANVIANQKTSEMRLNAKLEELTKLNGNARQALVMAADAAKSGDTTKAAQYNSAAETIANQLITVERDVESLKQLTLDSAQASDQAKAAVQQNSRLLQEKLSERSKLMSQLDQAKMQEEMNAAMSSLQETVGADVPTFSEVEQKIQARYAKARPPPSSTRRPWRAGCSRSSRRPPTSRPSPACRSCAPSSGSMPHPPHHPPRRSRRPPPAGESGPA